MRQLKHDAGGFSYKSTWTLLELFPHIILVVNVKLNTHKNIEDNTVTNSKIWLTQRGIPSTTQTSQPPRKDKKKGMRDEERESDEEVNSFVIMVKDDLVDQEGEGGGLLAYPENVWFAV